MTQLDAVGAKSPTWPQIPPVQAEHIPELLRQESRWVGWRPGPLKPSGKFDKFPVDPRTGYNIDPLDTNNWLTFDEAMAAHRRDLAKGVGFVLSDKHPITVDGADYFVTALDFDNCASQIAGLQSLWKSLGEPYVEVSPSGKGLRMLGLSSVPVPGGNAGDGRELYSRRRYVTVTGDSARGSLCDFTEGVKGLQAQWFGTKATAAPQPPSVTPLRPETSEHVNTVLEMLDRISSDIDYETWRSIVWALASTGWQCACQIAHRWSARTPHRYDPAAVDKLFQSFDPGRGISLGTLVHIARQNGWTGALLSVVQPDVASATPPPVDKLLITAAELQRVPATPYRVRGVLPARGIASIYGASGSGKSFLALDLAHAIAAGRSDWFGFNVQQGPVAYVALEGQEGISKRTMALEAHVKQTCPENLRFWRGDLQLFNGAGIDDLSSEILDKLGTGSVVIIDTLNQASPGADENVSQDMGKIIENAKRLAASTDGLVILVHHAGKDRARGLRGHSSLIAALDAIIEVQKSDSGRSWKLVKAKDDVADQTFDFDLVPYVVGQDSFGPVTSCAVQRAIHTAGPRAKQPTGKNQKKAFETLSRAIAAGGRPVTYHDALKLVADALVDCTPGKKSERAKDAVDRLIQRGNLCMNDEGICIT